MIRRRYNMIHVGGYHEYIRDEDDQHIGGTS